MEMERTLIEKGVPDNVLERMPLVGPFYADKMLFANGTIHYRVATHPNNMQLGYLSPKYAQELIDGVAAQAARIERLEKALDMCAFQMNMLPSQEVLMEKLGWTEGACQNFVKAHVDAEEALKDA